MKPVRTCVGCRQRESRSKLIRIVSNNQILTVDSKKSVSARGSWLHANGKCLELAISRNAFNRALRVDQKLDTSGLSRQIEQAEMMLAKK